MRFNWNDKKNNQLKKERNLSFEIMIFQIEAGKILDIIENPNKEKYSGQKIFIVEFDDYAYIVPFVENSNEIFLKTVIPSRKMTKKYLEN